MSRKTASITARYLREILHYDPETGIFTWKVKLPRARHEAGSIAGARGVQGHRLICIDGRHYRAARLAWLYVHGRWPKHEVDHVNTIKDDDRYDNLREATHRQNGQNTKRRIDNTSGFKGVSWHPTGRWFAYINVNRRRTYLGFFTTPEAAHAARCQAAVQYHGEFARFD